MTGLAGSLDYLDNELSTGVDDGLSQPASHNQKTNPLAQRISQILASPYADSEIREGLRILDERNIRNTAQARRRLRLDVEKELIDSNGSIVKDFGQVAQQLRRVGEAIKTLNQNCEVLRSHIKASKGELGPILEEANGLLKKKQEAETKKTLLDAFNKHFILSDQELSILTSTTELNDDFYVALNRTKRIYHDCQVLLGSEDQQLGLEMMEDSSRNLNAAYQKLHRWIQNQFKSLDLENPQMNAPVRKALRVLAERPALFQNCLDFFAENRERNLSDAFYSALTGTSTQTDDRTTKPMEFYAHEPLRFIGDMLAWTHSAAVSERESLEVLFISEGEEMAKGIKSGLEAEPWLDASKVPFDGRLALERLVNHDLSGVARALNHRITQVIQSDEDPVLSYKIANLIDFYRTTLTRLLGNESTVLEVFSNLQRAAFSHYRKTMKDHTDTVLVDGLAAPTDLDAPSFLKDQLNQLRELMKTYDSSFTPIESREANFKEIFADALDPYMRRCAGLAVKLEEPSQSMFTINCLMATRAVLASFDFATSRLTAIDELVDEHVAKLADYQHAFFLHTSGLHSLLVALASLGDGDEHLDKIPTLEAFDQQALADTSQTLDDFLPSALMDAMENLKRLKSLQIAERVTNDGADAFCEDFEFIESKLAAADDLLRGQATEGEEPVPFRASFPRTSGEIRVLLS